MSDDEPDTQMELFAPKMRAARARARRSSNFEMKAPTSSKVVSAAPAVQDVLLNVRDAARRLGLSKSTLDRMRGKGQGPRFIKTTDRAVRYDPKDIEAWIVARRRSST